MKSIAIAGVSQYDPHLGMSCTKLEGEDYFFLQINYGAQELMGIVAKNQLEALQRLLAEALGNR